GQHTDPRTRQPWIVATGEWTGRPDGNPDGLKIEMPNTFTLKRGDKQVVTVKRVKGPGVAVKPPAEEKFTEVQRFEGFPVGSHALSSTCAVFRAALAASSTALVLS